MERTRMDQATQTVSTANDFPVAYLILEDGSVFKGKAFGACREALGEVVFNTGMTGYQEVLSDPSYCGQMVVMTYPLIGNYGLNQDDYESLFPALNGLIVKEHCLYPSNWRQEHTLHEVLQKNDIPGLSGIDTRRLTRVIRQHGSMKGKIFVQPGEDFSESAAVQFVRKASLPTDQIAQVTPAAPYHCPGTGLRIVLIDYGAKAGIIKSLVQRNCDVRVVPYDTPAEEILRLNPDGVVLSNGPGNPKDVPEALHTVRALLEKVPMFSICMGHLLFALACGANTEKMKFGHRGSNHPVQDVHSGVVMMTTQNHSYTVAQDSLSQTPLEVTHVAVNDQTVEGLRHKQYPAFSVQFHPEASPGPLDSQSLFDDFIRTVHKEKQKEGRIHA